MSLVADLTTAFSSTTGVTASFFSSIAAFLAWKAKLQFADEFKEARDAEVKAAKQMLDSANAQKDAQIELVKVEIIKKDIEIEKLKIKIENLERETPKALKIRYEDMKAAYESLMADLPRFNGLNKSKTEQEEIDHKKDVFEAHLSALGDQLDWMVKASQEGIESRKEARKWLEQNSNRLAKDIYKYTKAKYPDLFALCESESPEFGLKAFYWDIESYLEILGHCLVTNRTNLIDQNPPSLSLPEPYRIAFGYMRRQIPKNLPHNSSEEIKRLLDYLIVFLDQYNHLSFD